MSSKKKDNLKIALALEKKCLTTYQRMEAEAKKRNAIELAKLFDELGRDNSRRMERIEELQKRMAREKRELDQ